MARGDAGVLLQLLRGQPRDGSHAERLQAFYAPQAQRYDAFRERLLHGRGELIERLLPPSGAVVVELGAGTGRNLDYFGERLAAFGSLYAVDLCPALLAVARARAATRPNVHVVEADATAFRPPQPADAVYFSYSLTMIPEWERALDNALAMLKPGGLLGCVDFYVSAAGPPAGRARHGWLTRRFWPAWFSHDGVRLDPGHLPALLARTRCEYLREARAPVPYLSGLRVPYYVFVGRKR
ncbi:MAG TPA: class I SAM-dependent methyltransferase [Pelomicrobium sp.]|nr:class I SAM-dependent methyltransferase [Pelomicrobium sp.]